MHIYISIYCVVWDSLNRAQVFYSNITSIYPGMEALSPLLSFCVVSQKLVPSPFLLSFSCSHVNFPLLLFFKIHVPERMYYSKGTQ